MCWCTPGQGFIPLLDKTVQFQPQISYRQMNRHIFICEGKCMSCEQYIPTQWQTMDCMWWWGSRDTSKNRKIWSAHVSHSDMSCVSAGRKTSLLPRYCWYSSTTIELQPPRDFTNTLGWRWTPLDLAYLNMNILPSTKRTWPCYIEAPLTVNAAGCPASNVVGMHLQGNYGLGWVMALPSWVQLQTGPWFKVSVHILNKLLTLSVQHLFIKTGYQFWITDTPYGKWIKLMLFVVWVLQTHFISEIVSEI